MEPETEVPSSPSIAAHVEKLRLAVAQAVAYAGLRPIAVGPKVGRARNYGNRLLSGELPLRPYDVFCLLLALELKPDRFLRGTFPFDLDLELALAEAGRRTGRLQWSPLVFGSPEIEERASIESTIWDADEWVEELMRLLRSRLLEGKVPQKVVASRLGVPASAFSRLFRGSRSLTFSELFRFLEAIESPPPRFFFELAAPGRTLEDRLAMRQQIEQFEVSLRDAASVAHEIALERRKKREALERRKNQPPRR